MIQRILDRFFGDWYCCKCFHRFQNYNKNKPGNNSVYCCPYCKSVVNICGWKDYIEFTNNKKEKRKVVF